MADRLASLAYHSMSFLDEASTTNYPTPAAAADQGWLLDYAHALIVHQPPRAA